MSIILYKMSNVIKYQLQFIHQQENCTNKTQEQLQLNYFTVVQC